MAQCPVCGVQTAATTRTLHSPNGYHYSVDCPRCGKFLIPHDLADLLTDHDIPSAKPGQLDAICHAVRRLTLFADGQPVDISRERFELLARDARIQTPKEQLDILVSWLGRTTLPSESIRSTPEKLLSIVGARITSDAYTFLIQNAQLQRLVDVRDFVIGGLLDNRFMIALTLNGWSRFEELQAARRDSKTAFMAMKFDADNVAQAYERCFQPAAASAGFRLMATFDNPQPGLIDDQIKVDIRNARFVVADLSDGNNGAYWEAGFAEGLGKRVIYTCDERIWNDQDKKPHFDTNHMATILWHPDKFPDAQMKMTAMIRNTFPADAKMSD